MVKKTAINPSPSTPGSQTPATTKKRIASHVASQEGDSFSSHHGKGRALPAAHALKRPKTGAQAPTNDEQRCHALIELAKRLAYPGDHRPLKRNFRTLLRTIEDKKWLTKALLAIVALNADSADATPKDRGTAIRLFGAAKLSPPIWNAALLQAVACGHPSAVTAVLETGEAFNLDALHQAACAAVKGERDGVALQIISAAPPDAASGLAHAAALQVVTQLRPEASKPVNTSVGGLLTFAAEHALPSIVHFLAPYASPETRYQALQKSAAAGSTAIAMIVLNETLPAKEIAQACRCALNHDHPTWISGIILAQPELLAPVLLSAAENLHESLVLALLPLVSSLGDIAPAFLEARRRNLDAQMFEAAKQWILPGDRFGANRILEALRLLADPSVQKLMMPAMLHPQAALEMSWDEVAVHLAAAFVHGSQPPPDYDPNSTLLAAVEKQLPHYAIVPLMSVADPATKVEALRLAARGGNSDLVAALFATEPTLVNSAPDAIQHALSANPNDEHPWMQQFELAAPTLTLIQTWASHYGATGMVMRTLGDSPPLEVIAPLYFLAAIGGQAATMAALRERSADKRFLDALAHCVTTLTTPTQPPPASSPHDDITQRLVDATFHMVADMIAQNATTPDGRLRLRGLVVDVVTAMCGVQGDTPDELLLKVVQQRPINQHALVLLSRVSTLEVIKRLSTHLQRKRAS